MSSYAPNKKDADEFILLFFHDSFYPEFLNVILRPTKKSFNQRMINFIYESPNLQRGALK